MGYLGMITGILIGHYAENVAMWIFALTAGLFMYVALVDMVGNIFKYFTCIWAHFCNDRIVRPKFFSAVSKERNWLLISSTQISSAHMTM